MEHGKAKKVFVIGCGRWGSFIAWYLNRIGNDVTLYGRAGSRNMAELMATRKNRYVEFPEEVTFTNDLDGVVDADIIIISIDTQGVKKLMDTLKAYDLRDKIFVSCMKGIVIETGERLSQVISGSLHESNRVAVWIGPGHVQDFVAGKPSCMVIDSEDEATRVFLADEFSSGLIRFYYGSDLIGNEIGAALKNVIGIAAGMLDGANKSSLKGALMSRGAYEVSRLISSMGGRPESAYGLCHLGDYEATLFSDHSHNRQFGASFVRGETMDKLAEGYYTVQAVKRISDELGIEMPICDAVYRILFEGEDGDAALEALFSRGQKYEYELSDFLKR